MALDLKNAKNIKSVLFRTEVLYEAEQQDLHRQSERCVVSLLNLERVSGHVDKQSDCIVPGITVQYQHGLDGARQDSIGLARLTPMEMGIYYHVLRFPRSTAES
jgi:hypothetical protein